jgi:ornithine cyclodeaminase
MGDLISAMEQALAAFSAAQVRQPVRSIVDLGTHGFFGVMPAAYELDAPRGAMGAAAAGTKVVTVVPRNHEQGLPSHFATIVMLDPVTGALDAIVDGRFITEARTAAVSAVSARHLARPGARVVAIIGSGVQARSHAAALAHVLAGAEFRVWSRDAAHRETAAREIATGTGLAARAAASAREAVEGADVVVLVTSARTPVVEDAWIRPGTHVIGVGACRPAEREMPAALVARARLVVDSRAAAEKESGDILLARGDGAAVDIAAELGEICGGTVKGREDAAGVTIFKSLGLAIEDVVAARLAVERARAQGIGQPVSL